MISLIWTRQSLFRCLHVILHTERCSHTTRTVNQSGRNKEIWDVFGFRMNQASETHQASTDDVFFWDSLSVWSVCADFPAVFGGEYITDTVSAVCLQADLIRFISSHIIQKYETTLHFKFRQTSGNLVRTRWDITTVLLKNSCHTQ